MTTPCNRVPPVSGAARGAYPDRTTLPGELEILERLLPRLTGQGGERFAGDDAAVLAGPAGVMLLCADAVVAGVHADLSLVGVDDLGWKAVVANASDIAAMGGRPRWATVTVSGPLGEVDVDLLYDGLLAAASEYGCTVVGGDLTSAPVLVVSVAMVGDLGEASVGPEIPTTGPPVCRSGARAGDAVFVTGPLGASAAGLELLRSGRASVAPELVESHRRPRARVAEGRAARSGGATAMIDVSDGLALDLRRVAAASGVGVVLDTAPVARGVEVVGDDPLSMALGGGEDYELLFTAPDAVAVGSAFAGGGLRNPLRIGVCVDDPSVVSLAGKPLPRGGWEHRA